MASTRNGWRPPSTSVQGGQTIESLWPGLPGYDLVTDQVRNDEFMRPPLANVQTPTSDSVFQCQTPGPLLSHTILMIEAGDEYRNAQIGYAKMQMTLLERVIRGAMKEQSDMAAGDGHVGAHHGAWPGGRGAKALRRCRLAGTTTLSAGWAVPRAKTG